MNTYSMTCTCGHVTSVEANSREEAVSKMQGMMTEEAIKAHMDEKHPGESAPSMAETHANIEKNLQGM